MTEPDRDRAWVKICGEIKKAIDSLKEPSQVNLASPPASQSARSNMLKSDQNKKPTSHPRKKMPWAAIILAPVIAGGVAVYFSFHHEIGLAYSAITSWPTLPVKTLTASPTINPTSSSPTTETSTPGPITSPRPSTPTPAPDHSANKPPPPPIPPDPGSKPTPVAAGLTATINSVKVLSDRLLQIYVGFENHTANDVAIYIGNPTGQNAPPPRQGLAVSVVDNAGISYWVLELDGVTKVEQQSDPHAIYWGWNQYVVVPAEGSSQVRFVFKPSQHPTENPTSIRFGASLGILSDLKSRKVVERYLSVPSRKVDTEISSGPSTEDSKKRSQIALGADLTATMESVRILNDKSLEIFVTFGNQGRSDIAVYMGNPTGQWARPPAQGLATSVTDNLGSSYWLTSLEGITKLPDRSVDPHAIYTGTNQFVTVPSGSSAQVRFVFVPTPRHHEPANSIDFTSEFRIVTDLKNRQVFDRTLNVLDYPVD